MKIKKSFPLFFLSLLTLTGCGSITQDAYLANIGTNSLSEHKKIFWYGTKLDYMTTTSKKNVLATTPFSGYYYYVDLSDEQNPFYVHFRGKNNVTSANGYILDDIKPDQNSTYDSIIGTRVFTNKNGASNVTIEQSVSQIQNKIKEILTPSLNINQTFFSLNSRFNTISKSGNGYKVSRENNKYYLTNEKGFVTEYHFWEKNSPFGNWIEIFNVQYDVDIPHSLFSHDGYLTKSIKDYAPIENVIEFYNKKA